MLDVSWSAGPRCPCCDLQFDSDRQYVGIDPDAAGYNLGLCDGCGYVLALAPDSSLRPATDAQIDRLRLEHPDAWRTIELAQRTWRRFAASAAVFRGAN